MKKNRFFPLALIAVAVFAGCSSMPQSATLDEARSKYSDAQANPQVTKLAPVELKEAGEALDRANAAQSKREDRNVVDNLAYLAKQKIAIAQETAKRKSAELAVANAASERNRVLLQARTIEADQARQQAAIAQQGTDQKTAELAVANAVTERQRLNLEARTAEAGQAQQQAALAHASAEQDKARLEALQTQLNDLHAKKTARGMVITLGDVLFDTNKAQLKSGSMRNVQKLADFLRQYQQRKVLIEGFTDSTGSNSRNQALSEQRANAVRTALIDMGTSSDRIGTRGYGESYPIAGNNNAAGRQLNRRVEIVLSDEGGNIAPR
ncbi:hypothetical protein TPL01_04220 [Sulfuriferula plumbiphila]|uniref:OmpA-like domain-containing protein n=1 Tax=Sulfuriferula plumbiphila TaxID=171865 RepID=A0A512L497_9PROT|nr:OmpA family protein [Sulfuriferula plumbiphila]BBP03887.1 hypothetical protein SFPGR_13090 [Sulfuriferula plumbiphila]GEP29284.1 hypothetical protein TPL01_04220 [Sulfuriferula plumbiphila]